MTARIGGKTGGRRRGGLDRGERQIVASEYANDLHAVYKKLGGVKWLLEYAKNNPKEFIQFGLSRLWPAPQKDDPDTVNNTQINIGDMSEFECARRVAFALAKSVYPDPSLAPIEAERLPPEPVFYPNQWTPPVDAPDMVESPQRAEADPAKALWVEEISLSPEQRRDNAVVRQTHGGSIESYCGSAAEQGGHGQRQSSGTSRPTVNEIRRRQMRDRLL